MIYATPTNLLRLIVVFILNVAAGYAHATSQKLDHLVPVEPQDFSNAWKRIVERRLFLTRADYGRVVLIPSGMPRGEYSVAIYPDSKSPTGTMATYTKASEAFATIL